MLHISFAQKVRSKNLEIARPRVVQQKVRLLLKGP